MKHLQVFTTLVLLSFSLSIFANSFLESSPSAIKYEYVELSMSTTFGIGARGNFAFIVQGEQDRVSTYRQRERLKDEEGNDLRFHSSAGIIEYMEHYHGYELLQVFTTGENSSRVHILMRRPISRE